MLLKIWYFLSLEEKIRYNEAKLSPPDFSIDRVNMLVYNIKGKYNKKNYIIGLILRLNGV
jgi:hypothetical protein